MNVTLATSLHLDHGALSRDQRAGDTPPMQSFVPLGLLCLKAAAVEAGVGARIRVTELNGLINQGKLPNDDEFYDRVVDAFFRQGDDVAGLMTDADSLPHTLIFAERIRRRSPHTLICLGGPASSAMSRLLLERFPAVDFVVRGEGEATFTELLRRLETGASPAELLGLSWRDRGEIRINPDRPVIENLDELPIPDFECDGVSETSSLYLDVGRGCPFRCRFCATAPFWSRRYRMKSTERILKEMRIARDACGKRHVNFSHDIFTCDRKWTLAFCESLRRADLGMTWSCSTRTDIVDREVLENLASAGCVEIYFGIETGSAQTQHFIEKDLNLDWSRQIVSTTAEVGMRAVTGFIVGHPNETMATLSDTLERFFEFLEIGKGRAHLFTLCPFHEAPMFKDYAHTIDRKAEYAEMALVPERHQEFEDLKRSHPDVFASLRRYATPGVPEKLVDASEEISCHLVVLKTVWPLLLPHYSGALEWYARWVDWIESRNARFRPGTALPHQGNAYDLLRFIEDELRRLSLTDHPLWDLIRYEEAKLDARTLGAPPPRRPKGTGPLSRETVLRRRCDYVACRVAHDMRALLCERVQRRFAERDEMWVIVARTDGAYVDTLQTNSAGKRVLELAADPQEVGTLTMALAASGMDEARGASVVDQLYRRGLLCEANV